MGIAWTGCLSLKGRKSMKIISRGKGFLDDCRTGLLVLAARLRGDCPDCLGQGFCVEWRPGWIEQHELAPVRVQCACRRLRI